ncbi:MAG: ATP-binding protein [Paludibacteraceae bacterium]|nr:ATP-binding protein [Paludibacteraceae bacterium]
MRFYNRDKEMRLLAEVERMSNEESQITVVTGRRRIGKTQLLLKACEGQTTLYFFVSRKSESLLCKDFVEEVREKLGLMIGDFSSFGKLFESLLLISKEQHFNLIIDEFQEFLRVNPSVYGDMQKYWDLHHKEGKMNLLISGSVNALMHKIFENSKEPLFGRAGNILRLKPFGVNVLKEILSDHYSKYEKDDLLALYALTGGVAWYVELMMKNRCFTIDTMLDLVFKEDSLFLQEGKNVLIEEFGKEYTVYFSILECIARGLCSRGEIESYLGNVETGGYWVKLDRDYDIIKMKRPIFSKPNSKQTRYYIQDNFLYFWFRFVHKYQRYIESGSITLLKNVVTRDFPVFSGIILERYFHKLFMEKQIYTSIGGYWDRSGENEIDLIAVNEIDEVIDFCEIKRQENNIDLDILSKKANDFFSKNPSLKHYKSNFLALSLKDM